MSKMSELHAEVQQAGRIARVGDGWIDRPYSGFELVTGAMRLTVTDQNDRGCGWCWHVSADYACDDIGRGGYLATADEAKRYACAWARAYCEMTLAAIGNAEAV